MATVLRLATPDDINAIFDIRTAVVQNHLSREQMAELGITPQLVVESMREAPCVWLAEVDGTPVAFSMVDVAEGEVFALFVLPSHENLGLGRQLMAVAEAALFERHDTLFLITDGRDHIRANGFYQRLGWSMVDTAEGDDVRYQKHKVQ
ncbi:GNAT family N-acetyltransferase [Pseudomonas yamanorum]|jgi:GNAT superfamily N-acetyltransferase|uniref:GNAT family N-acetyltransferase n=1 Tax=Pseudomonas yamanorum TaxID=515393 RepID=UPI003BA192AF